MKFREYVKENSDLIVESHFKVGEMVKCKKSGMEGKVVNVEGEGEDEIYTVEVDGKEKEYSPDELTKA
jgi:hypothetical protein